MLHVMSEFGGFFKFILTFFTNLVHPLSRYIYYLVMIKRLYFAKTDNSDIFQEEAKRQSDYICRRLSIYIDKNKMPDDLKATGFPDEVRNHR